MNELNEQNITLLAFTFDEYIAIGLLAEDYSYEISITPCIDSPKELKPIQSCPLRIQKRKAIQEIKITLH